LRYLISVGKDTGNDCTKYEERLQTLQQRSQKQKENSFEENPRNLQSHIDLSDIVIKPDELSLAKDEILDEIFSDADVNDMLT